MVDGETGAGVPLVLLRTGGYLQYYTDSAGFVAFDEPGLLGQPVWFSVRYMYMCHSLSLPCVTEPLDAAQTSSPADTPGPPGIVPSYCPMPGSGFAPGGD